jgi:hypothetical protein
MFSRQERGITREPVFHYSKGLIFFSLPWSSDWLVEAHCESCLLYNEVPFPRSFGWGEKLKLMYIVSTYELPRWRDLLDRHFFSVDPLNCMFNSIEISGLFNLFDFTLNFAFWDSVHESKYLHSYTNQWLYFRMHFPKTFQPVKPIIFMPKILCEYVNVRMWNRCVINRRVLTKF